MINISTCPISASTRSVEYLNLGMVPLVNNLCQTRKESFTIERFPLVVQLFPESNLSCLTEVVEKGKLFETYLYFSGINKPYLTHCGQMYHYLMPFVELNANDHVVDIGGNDGSLLKEFRKINPNLHFVNVEGSHSFRQINLETGFDYINEYFGETTALDQKAKIITSTNVLQHTQPVRSFVKGIFKNLADEGIWCLEFPYFVHTLTKYNYDQVYHEHIYYYILRNIMDLTSQEGLQVINASFHDIHAGTLRVIIAKETSKKQPDESIAYFLEQEKMITEEYCLNWGKQVNDNIQKYKSFIADLVEKKKKIAGFGAAGKGCVFLNSCGIDNRYVEYIIDDTPLKQGKFMPGTGIEVVSREYLKSNPVDYMLILAHNFKDYIVKSLADQYSGKFIVMYPEITVF